MNTIHYKILFFLCLSGNMCFGQSVGVLKTDIIGPLSGHFGVGYEHNLGKIFSAQLTYEWGKYGGASDFNGDQYKAKGHGVIAEGRYYPFRARKKWMLQPFIGMDYRYLRFYEVYETSSTFAYINPGTLQNMGLVAGGRLQYKRLCVELLFGTGVSLSTKFDYSQNSYYIPPTFTNGAFLQYEEKFYRTELSIGYFFGKREQEESPVDYYRNNK